MVYSRCVLVLLVSCSCGSGLWSQGSGGVWTEAGRFLGGEGDQVGRAVGAVADLDGDGLPELLGGAPGGGWGASWNGPGEVQVRSGADGRLLHRFVGESNGDFFGAAVAGLGDVDGDGVPEIAAGAPLFDPGSRSRAGAVYLYSGADGRLLRRIVGHRKDADFGRAIADGGDLDGDARSDLVLGCPGYSLQDTGHVRAVSGVSGALLWEVTGTLAEERLGTSLASIQDLDGDGRGELLVGAPDAHTFGPGAGSVRVYSGGTGGLLRQIDGDVAYGAFGYSLCRLDDLDGDGIDEVAVGQPTARNGLMSVSGRVQVVSLATGLALYSIDGQQAQERFGHSLCAVGDLDVDGRADLVIGAPYRSVFAGVDGAVQLHSGADGAWLHSFTTLGPEAQLGVSLASPGDLDGDRRAEILIGAPRQGAGHDAGVASLRAFDPYLRAAPTEISAAHGAVLSLHLALPAHTGSWTYRVLLSRRLGETAVGSTLVPLQMDGLFLRTLGGDYRMLPHHRSMTGRLNPAGAAAAYAAFPANALTHLIGQSLHTAAIAGHSTVAAAQISTASATVSITP